MKFHPLPPDAKCPRCGAGLVFVRVRGGGDLYRCASGGACRCDVFHYRSAGGQACGCSVVTYAELGRWVPCTQSDPPT
jgi:hypothetical protein